ncbi:translation initiation factor IF-2 associated domain-containing protein, partial [Propylenella binzhouense]
MTDTTSRGDKTIRVGSGGRKTISLKRDTDTVRQSFSGGRSKSVLVEKKRRRVSGPGDRPEGADEAPVVAERPREAPRPAQPASTAQPQQRPQ